MDLKGDFHHMCNVQRGMITLSFTKFAWRSLHKNQPGESPGKFTHYVADVPSSPGESDHSLI